MSRPVLLGLLVGAMLGAGVGALPRPQLGIAVWGGLIASIGAFQGWAGHWILRQSSDLPKMKAALPLSGAVLASLVCVFTGEGFLEPVLACFLLGTLIARSLAR